MKWPEATDYIARARAAAPDDPAPGLLLADMYASRQDWRNASATAAELVEKFPANLDVLDARGRAQSGQGDADGAVSTYKRAYELAPNSPSALSRYAAALDRVKDFPAARTVLRAALERDPQNASLKGDLIRVEALIGGLDGGLAKARDLAASDPGDSLYDVVSAELYEKAGRGAEAVGLLESAVAARPFDNALTAALSHLCVRMGKPAKAEAVLIARLNTDPKDRAVRSALALFYLEQKSIGSTGGSFSPNLPSRGVRRRVDPEGLRRDCDGQQRRVAGKESAGAHQPRSARSSPDGARGLRPPPAARLTGGDAREPARLRRLPGES